MLDLLTPRYVEAHILRIMLKNSSLVSLIFPRRMGRTSLLLIRTVVAFCGGGESHQSLRLYTVSVVRTGMLIFSVDDAAHCVTLTTLSHPHGRLSCRVSLHVNSWESLNVVDENDYIETQHPASPQGNDGSREDDSLTRHYETETALVTSLLLQDLPPSIKLPSPLYDYRVLDYIGQESHTESMSLEPYYDTVSWAKRANLLFARTLSIFTGSTLIRTASHSSAY